MQQFSDHHNTRWFSICMALVIASCFLIGLKPVHVHAQGTAQVVITGIPPVLSSPYISDLERNYDQGFFTTQFNYFSPSRQPQVFRFNLSLEVNGEVLIDMISEPISYTPGLHLYRTFDDEPAINFPLGYGDWIQRLDASVEQTGLLPEGDYVLRIEPIAEDELALIPTTPGIAFFSVRYAEPPLLLTPFERSNLTTQFPVFSWTPISGAPLTSTFEYEFLLVEVIPGQAPYQALESNIPHVQESSIGITSFVYTLDELPLEMGKTYAWQVRARDVNEQMPVLDRGETEFHTFTVGEEGMGAMLTSWSFPVSSPFLIYPFENNSDIDPSDTEIFIDGELPIELLGATRQGQFDKLLIDAETQTIIEGSLTLPNPIAFEVAINPLSDAISGYDVVSSGTSLTLSDGMVLELGENVVIDAAGLHPRGTHKALISYTGLANSEWTATYSGNFIFGFAPFGIDQGRVDFAADGVAQAYADASGFHLIDQGDPVIAQIPDRLQLPDENVAFIALKRSGTSLVDIEPTARGRFSVKEKAGIELELTLPGLQQSTSNQNQRYVASLDDVVIDAKTGQLVSGIVTAEAVGAKAAYTLDALGIPIAPTTFTTRKTETGVKLDIEGQFTLFGKPVQNADPVRFTMNEAGLVEGNLSIAEGAYVYLDGDAGHVSIDLTSAEGSVRIPLNAYAPAEIDIDVAGSFNINRGDNIVAGADIAFHYTGEGPVNLHSFTPTSPENSTKYVPLDTYSLQINEISSLAIFYTGASGLKYTAGLETSLLPYRDLSSVQIPLQGVELHQNSFYFPQQEVHSGSAGFVPFVHRAGPAKLTLLAVRIPAVTVAREDVLRNQHLVPHFDFEVSIDRLPTSNPFVHVPLTLQDARLQNRNNGIVIGDIIPFKLSHQQVQLPLEAGTFTVDNIAGSFAEKDTKQDLIIELEGTLDLVTSVATEQTKCSVPGVKLSIDLAGNINGSSSSFEPCAPFSIGPLAANFEEAALIITSNENSSQFAITGEVDSFSRPGSRRSTQATGPLTLDMLSGKILDADVKAEKLFWEFPVAAPQYQISVEETHLSADGFLLAADSTVSITDIATNDVYQLQASGTFRLGTKPSITNAGNANLVAQLNPQHRIAHFDESGFHPTTENDILPSRITLPGAFGAYIDVLQAGDDALEWGKTDKSGRLLKTSEGETAQLVLPQLGRAQRPIQIPVAFELMLDNALEFAAGTFEHDLSSRPLKLFAGQSPVSITHVKYDNSSTQLLLSGVVQLPAALLDAAADGSPEIDVVFALDASGLTSVNLEETAYPLYNQSLSLNLENIQLRNERENLAVLLGGQIDSPLLKHGQDSSSPLNFTAAYNAGSSEWQFEAHLPESRKIGIDRATLFLDTANPPTLKADPALVLELSGLMAMPSSISRDFVTGVSIEIGPGGIYSWQTGTLDEPQSFFNGFLLAHLESVDIFYDAEKQTLVTTIDGAFSTKITQDANTSSSSSAGVNPTDLLPFSGIELATNGDVTLGVANFDANQPDSMDSIKLLDGLPRMPVINQSFWIEELTLSSPGKGLSLEIAGSTRLPTPNGRRLQVGHAMIGDNTSVVFSDKIPVSIVLDSQGKLLDQHGNSWRPQLFTPNSLTPDSLTPDSLTVDRLPTTNFDITSAYLHFNPLFAEDNRIFTSAQVHVATGIGNNTPSDSTASDATSRPVTERHYIALGSSANTRHQPGLIIEQLRPQQYLLSEIASVEKPALTLKNAIFDTDVTSISLPEPDQLQFKLAGFGKLNTGDIQGTFPLEDITVSTSGIQDYGHTAGPSTLTFLDIGLFETGCVDFGLATSVGNASVRTNNARLRSAGLSAREQSSGPQNVAIAAAQARLSRLQFGAQCGDSLTVTLTDKLLAGTFGDLIFRDNGVSPVDVQVTNTSLDLGGLGRFSGSLAYNAGLTSPAIAIDGITTFRGTRLRSTGKIKQKDGRSSVGLLFSQADQPLPLFEDIAGATIVGGGVFLNPDDEDLELVELVLNERSNNSFSSNNPSPTSLESNQLNMLLPMEVTFLNEDDSIAVQGTGLMTRNNRFTTLDVDGAFLNRTEELGAGLFLVERTEEDDTTSEDAAPLASTSLEGLANISLNYTSVAGGIVQANFEAALTADNSLSWSAYGRSDIDITDTIRLPGQVLLTQRGLLIDLYDAGNIKAGQLSIQKDLNLTLWSTNKNMELKGYSSFEAEYDLIPGYSLSSVNMHGAILKDREEHLFYAAKNIFTDVPYVYTGPIDPWISLQEGLVVGGDARNTTFRRMITDARQFSNAIPGYAREVTSSLQNALNVQASLASDLIPTGNLPYFARPDSILDETGQDLLSIERSSIPEDELPAIFESLFETLYSDENHPEYGYFPDVPAPNPATLAALQAMNTSVDQARRSADSDIFTFNGLLPRPLLWNADYIDLNPELQTSPVTSIVWPGASEDKSPGFEIDPNLQFLHGNSLLTFKQNNEGLDVQFLRTVGGMELNMVNLKIARSPEQAINFSTATSNISKYYATHIDSDWSMLEWSNQKSQWLSNQEDAVRKGVKDNLRSYNDLENNLDAMRAITQTRYNQVRQLARHTDWKREDLPEDQRFAQYLSGLDEAALKQEFETTATDLWFDVPMAALASLSDTLTSLIQIRNERYETGMDTLNKAYGAFSLSLDPLYDIQTRFTTTLYGMAEEYRSWRSSIRRLDPEAVNYAFQFLPYRGNYRILAEDLIPPTIEGINISPNSNRFLNNTTISWTANHPVELSETSVAISLDASTTPHFASVSSLDHIQFYTAKPDVNTMARTVGVTLRVRGAGGIPAVKRGQFTVSVDPNSVVAETAADTPLIPADTTPPPAPAISDLSYSSYFSETPNTLKFNLGAMNDAESGIAQIDYRIVNDRDPEEVYQDWTALQKSTSYFAGRLVETSLPIQEEDISVRVSVRARNEAGLSSESSEAIALDLDETEPFAAIANATYFNAFNIHHPSSISLELGEISDAESGIDLIEYTLQRNAQASLANADWQELLSFPDRDTNTGYTTVFITPEHEDILETHSVLSLYLRVSNGAGLQTIVNRAIEIPGRDVTPPSEPILTLEHSGFYGPRAVNQLRIILGGSQDLESGIASVEFRVIDGKSGDEISGWDNFVFLDPNSPTFILPTIEKLIQLPSFDSGRTIIVETRTQNAAGLQSTKGIRFIQLEMDDTAPSAPTLAVNYINASRSANAESLILEIGPSQDLESSIADVSYRIVNLETLQPFSEWSSLIEQGVPTQAFQGMSAAIDASIIDAAIEDATAGRPGVQVMVTNLQGLQTIVAAEIHQTNDLTPPTQPALVLESVPNEDETDRSTLSIFVGASMDPETGIGSIRYRIRDLHQADSTVVTWTAVPLPAGSDLFEGATLRSTVPTNNAMTGLLVDLELTNKAGQITRVSGLVDEATQHTYLNQAPVSPEINLFYFDNENEIRKDQLEVKILPGTGVHTTIDSLQFRLTTLDRQGLKIADHTSWQSIPYRTSGPNSPLITYLPLPQSVTGAKAQFEARLVNANGLSAIRQAFLNINETADETAPLMPAFAYAYSEYDTDAQENHLAFQIAGIQDPESRIASASYRIINDQNPSDIILDWTDLTSIDDAGNFTSENVSVSLPTFSRNRELRLETRATNGAGLTASTDTLLSIIVDRTPPIVEQPELTITGVNDTALPPLLHIDLGTFSDEESHLASAAYRVIIENDSTGAFIDWTPVEMLKGNQVRFHTITQALPVDKLNKTFTLELEVQNEAGLIATINQQVKADLDNSAPQMPRVQMSYKESELGTGYLLIEPGAFRDAESNIASLEYRLVDNDDPDFVLIDWISIPVPREIRVSVPPIAIPRSEIPYDGATQVATEFRATNGAGLFSIRRSTIALPGDVSPPESPSLILAHRNAYDPLHPNTVEIQIGSSEDNQSSIAQAQYRITNESTGEELASWTQLPLASEGYFPGTILFKELPLIENSTSLEVEVEILNTAGLVNKITQKVQVNIKNDATPPVTDISLHYFSNEMALVLDHLADPESKIQKVEYRFLDNVDQSELMGWTDLFEIAIPLDRYPKQSYKIKQPAVSSGRTLKVEVRVTNGAGLQTTDSKTVLVRSPGSGQ